MTGAAARLRGPTNSGSHTQFKLPPEVQPACRAPLPAGQASQYAPLRSPGQSSKRNATDGEELAVFPTRVGSRTTIFSVSHFYALFSLFLLFFSFILFWGAA